ncbi:FAD/NAD(P)-binding protein [Leucobacter coleopterorum]|uniref:FAD/NAD(P)-binding protein n=1 Tax=Leucobacter coleopterorum TaxID=2714933 RepID=UPI001FCBFB78|nr:FAD/NAD(P)-binding protein [Leucobacter coleopterorum]
MTSKPSRASIAIIGAGPRGTSLIERIGASLTGPTALDLHVIDEAQSGAGRIWRTDQTRELCMNTLAGAVTLFTEESSSVAGPVLPGPTQYEWCVLVRDTGAVQDQGHASNVPASTPSPTIPPAHTEAFHSYPVRDGLAAEYREELAGILPESHPSRALYGEYLSWCYHRAVAQLPEGVRVIRHRSRAVAANRADRPDSRETILLADGTNVTADSVIIAAGWLPRNETSAEQVLATAVAERPELTWVRPESPVDQDLSGIAPGSDAIVRGLGMGFFDTMALLTVGRGGVFAPDPAAPGGLCYTPSGREPILHVTSRRGVPFRAKSLYHSLPPKPAQRFLRGLTGRPLRAPSTSINSCGLGSWPTRISTTMQRCIECGLWR